MVKKSKSGSLSEKLLNLQVWSVKRSGRWLTKSLSSAIKHLPDREELVYKVFKRCVMLVFMIKRSPKFVNKISFTQESLRKNKWTTFLDKLNSLDDLNSLTIYLFKILLRESILKERVSQPFWTPAFKGISEKLLLPTKTDCVDSDTNSSNMWSKSQEVKSPFLTIKKMQEKEMTRKNLPMTSLRSSMSFLVDKWEKEVTPPEKLRTIVIQIFPKESQKKKLNEFIDTCRYVYNKTVESIHNGHKINERTLKDKLVTYESQKGSDFYVYYTEKLRIMKKNGENEESIRLVNEEFRNAKKTTSKTINANIKTWELETPKDLRDCSVTRVTDAYKSGFKNLERGNIKHFRLSFKKKTDPKQTIEFTEKTMKIRNGIVRILPESFNDCVFRISKRNMKKHSKLKNNHNVDMVREDGKYFLHIPIDIEIQETTRNPLRVSGIDMGIRSFSTICSYSDKESSVTEYCHNRDTLKRLNGKLDIMKSLRKRRVYLRKIEKRKKHLVNQLHWEFINDVMRNNDVLYYGDIKSHDIVKDGPNHSLNREFNDLKFHKLKLRLKYKASLLGVVFVEVPEPFTTKTCSSCGAIHETIGSNKVFECPSCKKCLDRDHNSGKNMILKGVFSH